MRSFVLIGNYGFLSEKLGAYLPEETTRVFRALFEQGFFHGLDEFCCFKAFDSSRVEFRIHSVFSTEHHCSVCGTIQAGNSGHKCGEVGCGGILAPTSRAEPLGDPPEPIDIWPGMAIERLDISMHK